MLRVWREEYFQFRGSSFMEHGNIIRWEVVQVIGDKAFQLPDTVVVVVFNRIFFLLVFLKFFILIYFLLQI